MGGVEYWVTDILKEGCVCYREFMGPQYLVDFKLSECFTKLSFWLGADGLDPDFDL